MIFLYGAPASGKTTLGKRLAAALKTEFVDLDEVIVRQSGKAIAEIFAERGEAEFRQLECAALQSLAKDDAHRVVALGGGTLLNAANREFCEAQGTVICLETPPAEELARRLGKAAGTRPLGDKSVERAAHYAAFASRIAAVYELENSLVVIGRGIAPALTHGLPAVADSNVTRLHADKLPSVIATIPSGEVNKTPATVMRLWQTFAKFGLGRKDAVAAFGGGVTGDLTGFAAATFMRGIDWVNVPTTLLAMVDASTGGKTGCDLPEGKNLAGAFNLPRLVVVDTDFLTTLSPETLREGKAEMIKHAIIGGCDVFDATLSASSIAKNLAVKVGIVREDPFERTGRRMLLNCGHTVGHAVETLSQYRLSHGQAVAIGCVAEAQLAVKLNLASKDWPDELAAAFAAEGLPTEIPSSMTWSRLVEIMKGDKKREEDSVTFALPCAWGDVRAVKLRTSELV